MHLPLLRPWLAVLFAMPAVAAACDQPTSTEPALTVAYALILVDGAPPSDSLHVVSYTRSSEPLGAGSPGDSVPLSLRILDATLEVRDDGTAALILETTAYVDREVFVDRMTFRQQGTRNADDTVTLGRLDLTAFFPDAVTGDIAGEMNDSAATLWLPRAMPSDSPTRLDFERMRADADVGWRHRRATIRHLP